MVQKDTVATLVVSNVIPVVCKKVVQQMFLTEVSVCVCGAVHHGQRSAEPSIDVQSVPKLSLSWLGLYGQESCCKRR